MLVGILATQFRDATRVIWIEVEFKPLMAKALMTRLILKLLYFQKKKIEKSQNFTEQYNFVLEGSHSHQPENPTWCDLPRIEVPCYSNPF